MVSSKSRCAPSGQTIATGWGLYIRRVRSEYSFPLVFSPRVISPRCPRNRTESGGDTDLGEVAEPAPPTSDGSEGKLRSYGLEVMLSGGDNGRRLFCFGQNGAPKRGCA